MTKSKIKNMHVPGLFGIPSYLTKITLKKPLSRGSCFKIYFRLERRGNRGSRLNFHGIPLMNKLNYMFINMQSLEKGIP